MKKLSELNFDLIDLVAIDCDGTCIRNLWPRTDTIAVERASGGKVKLDAPKVFKMFKDCPNHETYFWLLSRICSQFGFELPESIGELSENERLAHIEKMIRKEEATVMEEHYNTASYRPGFAEVAEQLGSEEKLNKRVSMVTNIERRYVEMLRRNPGLRFDELFHSSFTSDDVTNKKPDPEMVIKAMKFHGVKDPRRVLMIGDGGPDIALVKQKELLGMEVLNFRDLESTDEKEQRFIDENTTYQIDDWHQLLDHIEKSYQRMSKDKKHKQITVRQSKLSER